MTKKIRWKDTLPLPESSRLEDAAHCLAWAIGYTHGSPSQVHHVSRAAAIIRAARKNLDADYGRVGDNPARRGSDLLLWVALNCTATAALVGTHERKSYHLRAAEACLRTYWREIQR